MRIKKLLIFPLLFLFCITKAQTNNIELYDFIKNFAPDSTMGKTAPKILPLKNFNVLINGKILKPDEDLLIDKVNWISFYNKKGTLLIQATGYKPRKNTDLLNTLFNNHKYGVQLIKRCVSKDDPDSYREYYKLKFPAKKTVYIKLETSASYGPYMPMIEIVVCINEADLKIFCPY